VQADRESVPAGPELVHLAPPVYPYPAGQQSRGHAAPVRDRFLEHVASDDRHQIAVAVDSVIAWRQNGNPKTRTVLTRGDDPPEPPATVLTRGDDPPEPPAKVKIKIDLIKIKIYFCRTALVKPDQSPPSLRVAGERTQFTGQLPDGGFASGRAGLTRNRTCEKRDLRRNGHIYIHRKNPSCAVDNNE
jgi:hypothetical protein